MADIFDIETPKRGAPPLFKPFHIMKALYYLREKGTIGRKSLAELVGIGEGSARGLSTHLENHGLASRTETGIKLTKKGTRMLNKFGFDAASLDAGELTVDEHDFAIKLTGKSEKITNGLKERDEAIKADATGATTILFMGGNLVLPDNYDIDASHPEIARKIRDIFYLENGDVIIIGTGPNSELAEDGAFAAAVSLLIDQNY